MSEFKPGKPKRRSGGMGKGFTSVEKVLDKLVTGLGLERRLKEHTLLNLWPSLSGEPFASGSRAIFIDHEGNYVVAVKNAAMGQELSLRKSEMLKHVRFASNSLGLKINGIRVDLKHYHRPIEPEQVAAYSKAVKRNFGPSKEQLASVQLDSEEITAIDAMRIRLEETAENPVGLRERLVQMFEQELKMRRWLRENNAPKCPECGNLTAMLHGVDSVCSQCFFNSLTQS